MKKRKAAQSTIEYILLLTAVVALLIVFLSPTGDFRNMIADGVTNSIEQIQTMTDGTNFLSGVQHGHCGDGFCVPPETLVNCPEDCQPSNTECGNGICEFPPETIFTCPEDCDNSSLDCPFQYSPEDCSAVSGCRWAVWCQEVSGMCTQCSIGQCKPNSWTCDTEESSFSPCDDCGMQACCGQNCYACEYESGSPFCGDGICEFPYENNMNCPEDCDVSQPACNNNGTCDPDENCDNCPDDCSTGCDDPGTVECGVVYYDNCEDYCGIGQACPAPGIGCTMECRTSGCWEDCE
ncbi:MAG: hypothetical protein PHY73_07515 [Candidatus Omnitrophica bacterium]|nr:hypothetical protein [Candidatus Omnitrophota bacterium]